MGDEPRDHELLDLAREGLEAIAREDIDGLGELIHPDFEFRSQLAAAEGRVYRGIDGIREYYRDIEETFETFDREVLELERVGERAVVSTARVHAVGRGSGVVIDQPLWTVTKFEGRLAIRFESYWDRESAYVSAREFA